MLDLVRLRHLTVKTRGGTRFPLPNPSIPTSALKPTDARIALTSPSPINGPKSSWDVGSLLAKHVIALQSGSYFKE